MKKNKKRFYSQIYKYQRDYGEHPVAEKRIASIFRQKKRVKTQASLIQMIYDPHTTINHALGL